MNTLVANWEEEFRQSRIVVMPNGEGYIKEVDVKVWDILHQLAQGLTERQLQQQYPLLTESDLRACGLFGYFSAVKKI
ncbi:DUF433 domain-containing protein [Spirosoma rigui]|uniref:DUF433 domain-containing protein n=1 Tax=Spirosoma rigui TaxID=564064 RepID=UPI0009B079A5|nr:DUF433 domain-containing protein [Spirosoma rigui]